METKKRKIILSITILYAIIILYFMFLGFGRIDAARRMDEFTFIWVPDSVFSLRFPRASDLDFFMLWLFDFGNLTAFIPFGILIPLLFRLKFIPFVSMFFAAILLLETLQALTLLGSFDINDAIQNTMGAAIGYGASKLGFRSAKTWSKLIRTGLSAVVLIVGVLGLSEAVRATFAKVDGPVIALTELQEANGKASAPMASPPFSIGGKTVTPAINLYAIQDKHTETYTYHFGKKEVILAGHYGIPDGSHSGKLTIFADGIEILNESAEWENGQIIKFELPLEKVDELTITLESDQKLWDVTFKEKKHRWE